MVITVKLQQRDSKDSDKLYPPDGNCLEDADHSELKAGMTNPSIQKMRNNGDYRGRTRAHTYCREWHSSVNQSSAKTGTWMVFQHSACIDPFYVTGTLLLQKALILHACSQYM